VAKRLQIVWIKEQSRAAGVCLDVIDMRGPCPGAPLQAINTERVRLDVLRSQAPPLG